MAKTSSAGREGGKVWLDKAQLLEVFKNEAVVQAIIKNKKSDPTQWRPNEDCPDCEDAIQFRVADKETEKWQERETRSSTTQLAADLDQEAGVALLPQRTAALMTSSPTLPAGVCGGGQQQGADDKDKLEEEKKKKQAEKEAKAVALKAEKERLRNLPATQVQKWLTGLAKDIMKAKHLQSEVLDDPAVPVGVAGGYKDTFAAHEKELMALRVEMETAAPSSHEALVHKAPLIVGRFLADLKAWKGTKNTFKPKPKAKAG